MPYVQRDISNNVMGLYAIAQPGYAEEFLADDNSAVVAYKAKVATFLNPAVPQAITPLQARKALNAANLRSSIEAYIASQSQSIQDAWQFANMIYRNDAMILSAAAALSLSSDQLDQLFIAAAGM